MAIQLEASDKNAILVGPHGENFVQRDGIVELPDKYHKFAIDAVQPRTLFRRRSRAYAGFDAAELAERYQQWEESRRVECGG